LTRRAKQAQDGILAAGHRKRSMLRPFWAHDIKRSYATASIISADRVVFNIKGNDYRLVAAVDFEKSIVWIKWIGTHHDYDKIDVREVRHGDD
jgi:mRNA interferase HigB